MSEPLDSLPEGVMDALNQEQKGYAMHLPNRNGLWVEGLLEDILAALRDNDPAFLLAVALSREDLRYLLSQLVDSSVRMCSAPLLPSTRRRGTMLGELLIGFYGICVLVCLIFCWRGRGWFGW